MSYQDISVNTHWHFDFAKHVDSFYGVFEGDVLWGGNYDGAFRKISIDPRKSNG